MPSPADRLLLIEEAAKRGILPPDMQPLYNEAVKRGLIGKQAAEQEPQEPQRSNIAAKGENVKGVSRETLEMFPDKWRVQPKLADMFAQGGSFGASDEIVSGLMAPFRAASEGTSLKEAWDQGMAEEAARLATTREAYPKASTALEIVGALGTMKGTPRPANTPKPSMPKRMVKGGAQGAAGGGTYGFMTGDDLEDRAKRGLQGAGTGALIGTTLPPVVEGGRAITKAVTAPFRSYAAPEKYAAGKVAQAFERDNRTPQKALRELDDLRQVSPNAMVADVGGQNVKGLMRSALNMPNAAREGFGQRLDVRQAGQFRRVRDAFDAALGNSGEFEATTRTLIQSRKTKADQLFAQAFRTPTAVTSNLKKVLSRPLTVNIVSRAQDAAKNRGENFLPILKNNPQTGQFYYERVPRTEDLHRIKLHLDAMIGAVKKRETSLDNVTVRDLVILKKDLLKAIKNDPYKRALSEFAGDSALINALEDGIENGLRMTPAEIRLALRDMSPSERQLWRLGLSRSIVDKLGEGHKNRDRIRMLDSPNFMDRLRAAFPDLQGYRQLQRYMAQENAMTATRQAAQGNSTTAKQLAEGDEAGFEALQDMGAAGMAAVRGDFLGVMQRIGRRFTGLNPRSAAEILRILQNGDYASRVSAAQIRREFGNARVDRLISALNRVLSQRGSDLTDRLSSRSSTAPRAKETARLPAL
jgi:hypothetical protein